MGVQLLVFEQRDTSFEKYLHNKIKDFNNIHSPHHRAVREEGSVRPIYLQMYDEDERLVGGLSAETYWNWLEINDFWIRDDLRGKGYGTRMLTQVEEIARQRGCRRALLRTFCFNSLEFYLKFGYQEVGRLEDYPPGATFYWLAKDL